jgi:hypothetical protein
MLKNPEKYEKYILSVKLTTISHQVSPDLLLGVCWYLPGTLVDESGMIRIQMVMHTKSENDRSAWDTLYDNTQ